MKFCDGCGTPQLVGPARRFGQAPLEYTQRKTIRINPFSGVRLRFVPDLILSIVLFVLTALTIFPFFFGDFTQNFGSIESAYISDSIFIANSFPYLGWYPFWYGGFPFHLSYPPLFVALVAALHFVSGFSIGRSYRILGGIAYSTVPVALYLLSKFLTKNRAGSFCAGLIYALVPTFLPSVAPARVDILASYGEAPHLFGLALALVSILQLFRCVSTPTWPRCALAAILIAGVALSNLIALYGLGLLIIAALLTEVMYRSPNAVSLTSLIGVIAYGLSAFQYDLGFISSSAQFAGFGSSPFHPLEIAALATLLAGVVLLHHFGSRLFFRHKHTKVWFFYATWLAIFLLVIAGGQNWFGLPVIAPQSGRFVPEFDAGISLSVGLLLIYANKFIMKFLSGFGSVTRLGSQFAVFGAFFIILLIASASSVPHSLTVTQPTINLNNVPEYRIARWLSEHVNDESVFASGTVAFWLDVFSNVREIRGGSDQGGTNPWWEDVANEIRSGTDPQISVLLAEAWNVKYIVVTFPNASTAYHDFAHPEKFQNVLPVSYYFEGNGVYEVPLVRPALIEAVSGRYASTLPAINGVLDHAGLSRYVDLTQNSTNDSGAKVTYSNVQPDSYHIAVSGASKDTAILVKMTYDLEWHAEMNGAKLEIFPIGLGFMIIYPQTQGAYSLDLHFDRALGQTVGLIVTILTLSLFVAISLKDLRARRLNANVKRERTERPLAVSSIKA